MKTMRGMLLGAALALLPLAANAQHQDPNIVKVPCREMGDGRTLIDSGYLPDWTSPDTQWDIIAKKPTSMTGEWANYICTIRLKGG